MDAETRRLILEFFDPANAPVLGNCESEARSKQDARRARLLELADREKTVPTYSPTDTCPRHEGPRSYCGCGIPLPGDDKRATALEAENKDIRAALKAQAQHFGGKITAERETSATRLDLCELAWGIIANAGGGDWKTQTPEWQEAAARWRDDYCREISPALAARASSR